MQLRIGDAGLDRRLQAALHQGGRQVVQRDRVAGEGQIGKGRGGLARAVIQQRAILRQPPGIGERAVQLRRRDRVLQHRAVGELEVVQLALSLAQQALHRTGTLAVGQAGADVEVGAAVGDGHALAGVPAHHVAAAGVGHGAGRQSQGLADAQRIGGPVQPHLAVAVDREGDPVSAKPRRGLVDHADGRGRVRVGVGAAPGLGADLDVVGVGRVGRLRQGELADRLEVVQQVVERRDVHVAERGAGQSGRRRRDRDRHDGAGHREGDIVHRLRVAGRVGVRRIQHHRFCVDTNRVGVQRDHRFGVGSPRGDIAERREAGVQELIEIGDGELAGQPVGRHRRAVGDAEVGEQRRPVLLRGAQVQGVAGAAAGQVSVAAQLLDQRQGGIAGGRVRIDDFRLRAGAHHRFAQSGGDADLQFGVRLRAEGVGQHIDGDLRAGLAGGDLHRPRPGAADDVGRPQIVRTRRRHLVLDRGGLRLGGGQIDRVTDSQRAAGGLHRGGGVGGDASIRQRRRHADRGGGEADTLLLHARAALQCGRVAGHQQVDRRGLDQVRIGDAGGCHLLFGLRQDAGGQLVQLQQVLREIGVGEGRGGLARGVAQQRRRVGHPPGIGIGAVQFGLGDRLGQDGAIRQPQIRARVAVIRSEQALDMAGVGGGQGDGVVDVGAAQRDGHRLAGIPVDPVLVARQGGDRPAGQGQHLADTEAVGHAIDVNARVGGTDAEGDVVGTDRSGDLGQHADRGAVAPRLHPALHLEGITREGGLGQDEFARRLEVVIEAVEGRDVHVAPGGRHRHRRRRRRGRGQHRAGDRQGHRRQRGAVAGVVAVGRVERHRLAEGADRVGQHLHHGRGVGLTGTQRGDSAQAAVLEGNRSVGGQRTGQKVHRHGAVVQHAVAGLQWAAVLLDGAEVQHIVRTAAGQVAVAGQALDQRQRGVAGGRASGQDFRLCQRGEHGLAAGRGDHDLQVLIRRAVQHVGGHGDGEDGAGLSGLDGDLAAGQGAAEVGRTQEARTGIVHAVIDRRRLRLGAGQIDGEADGPRAGGGFDHLGHIGRNPDIRRHRGRRGQGRVAGAAGAFLLLHVGTGGQRLRVAGEQIVDDRRLLQVRVRDAGRFGGGQRLRHRIGRQVAQQDLIVREVRIAEGRGILAGTVIHQRHGIGQPPGIGVLAIQFGVGNGPVGHHRGTARQHQVVVGVAVVIAQQALHLAGIAVRQRNGGVEVGARIGDVEFFAGIPDQAVAVGRGLRQGAVGQVHHRIGQADGGAVDPDHVRPVDREGDGVVADLGGDHGVDADRGTALPRLHARLDVEAVAGDGRLRQGEFAGRLEVVVQAIERRQMDIAPGVGDARRRNRLGCCDDRAGDRHRLRRQRARKTARVVAGRVQGHRFGERADRAGGQNDDRAGVHLLRRQREERSEAAVGELRRAGDREVAFQLVGGAQHVVQHTQIGAQRRRILRDGPQIERVVRRNAGRGQRAVAGKLLDRRDGILIDIDRRLDIGSAQQRDAVAVDAGAVALQPHRHVTGIGAETGVRQGRRQRGGVGLAGPDLGRAAGGGDIGTEALDGGDQVLGIAVVRRGVAHRDGGAGAATAVTPVHIDRVRHQIGRRRTINRAGDRDLRAAGRRGVAAGCVGFIVQRNGAGLHAGG